ncbi:MAG: hypothetical protein ACYS15_10795 [Planctomycetota bacterium]|jgi:hypothetical protein
MFTTTSVCCGGICAVAVITSTSVATFGDNVRINEARIDQPGSDLDEFFELAGPVGAPLDGLVYIVIGDGMAGNNGIVEEVTDLGGQSLDGSGLFVAAEATFGPGTADLITELNFENGDNVSHLLVAGFTGGVGDDLDLEDDGVLDVTPWASIVDGVALIGPTGPGDHVYCPTRVGPDGPGPPFHVYRCSPSMLWRVGLQDPAVGDDTPGTENLPCPCLADLDATGDVDAVDVAELLDAWGPCLGCAADFNTDTVVGPPDLAFLLESWGPCSSAPAPGVLDLFDETIVVDATDQDAADRGFVVTHLYATGDGVGVGDALLAVGLADIDAINAEFFQEPIFGGSFPPDSFFFQFEPALRYDTFVTINQLADDDNTSGTPGLSMDAAGISGDWFPVPSGGQAEAVDISAVTGNPGQAGVLIAQITLVPCTAPPGAGPARPGYSGTVTLFTSAADGGTFAGVEARARFPACPADVDADGIVGITDFLAMISGWGACPCCRADIDGDGAVGITDFLALVEGWGSCP